MSKTLRFQAKMPTTLTGIAYVDGTFTATDSSTATTLVFQPSTPLKPNTQYTVFLLGGDAQFSPASIKDTQGNPLAVSYQWNFTTGSLNLPAPPVSSPLAPVRGAVVIPLDPGSVRIDPRVQSTGNDLPYLVSGSGLEQRNSRAGTRGIFRQAGEGPSGSYPVGPGEAGRQGGQRSIRRQNIFHFSLRALVVALMENRSDRPDFYGQKQMYGTYGTLLPFSAPFFPDIV